MLVKNTINALLGALLSLIAAYVLIVTFGLQNEIARFEWSSINPMDILIGAPIYTLAYTYWILIPVGALLGVVIPLLVRKKTRREALVYGILIGVTIGLVFGCFIAYDFAVGSSAGSHDRVRWWGRFLGDFASSAPLSIVYCSIWTSAYAFIKAGGASVERVASVT